jgi:hypothetical protein
MKRRFFLLLSLIVLGAASVNAQVRIGGTSDPDKSAVLDLNPNEGNANGGLALPRVELTSETQKLNGTEPQPGTMVYNTSTALDGEGTYVWTKVSGSGSQGVTSVSGKNGITVTNGTSTPEISLPEGQHGDLLMWYEGQWRRGVTDVTVGLPQAPQVLLQPGEKTRVYHEDYNTATFCNGDAIGVYCQCWSGFCSWMNMNSSATMSPDWIHCTRSGRSAYPIE